MTKKLVKADKIAELIDVPKPRVYELTREGKIPYVQVGDRQYRYDPDCIFLWISNGGSKDQPGNKK